MGAKIFVDPIMLTTKLLSRSKIATCPLSVASMNKATEISFIFIKKEKERKINHEKKLERKKVRNNLIHEARQGGTYSNVHLV